MDGHGQLLVYMALVACTICTLDASVIMTSETFPETFLSRCAVAVQSGAYSSYVQRADTRCDCSRCDDNLVCCSHPGVSARIAAFEFADEWFPRLADFNNCTGAHISVEFPVDKDGMSAFIKTDAGTAHTEGVGLYDAYVIRAPWIHSVQSKLMDFSEWFGNSTQLRSVWNAMNPASKASLEFGGSVRAVALDSDYIALGCRSDVFDHHQLPHFPRTLEELVEISEILHGQDHNNDGQPDWGTCFTPQASDFYAFLAPIMQSDGGCFAANGEYAPEGCENIFFNTTTMEPLIDNAGVRYALKLFNRFMMASNCNVGIDPNTPGYCNHLTAFPTGRCACVVSMPETMNKLLGAEPGHRYTINNYSMFVANLSDIEGGHFGRRLAYPGSHKVYDSSSNSVVPCTSQSCPFSKSIPDIGLVNYAPYFSEGGEAYAIRAESPLPKRVALVDFFTWMSTLPIVQNPLSGQYSLTQLEGDKAEEFRNVSIADGWPEIMVSDLLNVTYCTVFIEGGNQVQDLFIDGFTAYMSAVEESVYTDFMLLRLNSSAPLDEQVRLHNQAWTSRYNDLIRSWKARVDQITENLGPLQQLIDWRDSLALPKRTKAELCENLYLQDASCPASFISAPSDDDGVHSTIIIISVLLGVAVLIAVVVFFFVRKKMQRRAYLKMQLAALKLRVEGNLRETIDLDGVSNLNMRRSSTASHHRVFETISIDESQLEFHEILGKGEYGVVKKALYYPTSGPAIEVAVKMMKTHESATTEELEAFLFESAMLATLNHPNIVKVIGVQDVQTPLLTVLELLPLGSLINCLRDPQYRLKATTHQQIKIMEGVAGALSYLHSIRIIHCDIAARNVLLGNTIDDVKLSDFGLARQMMFGSEYYKKLSDDKMPIKWMAPEAILYRKNTSPSDVWGFGVLSWEIFTFGVTPWALYSNVEAVLSMSKGKRLSLPTQSSCPLQIYCLMLDCWENKPEDRPSASHIYAILSFLLQQNTDSDTFEIPDSWYGGVESCQARLQELEVSNMVNHSEANTPDRRHSFATDYEYSPAVSIRQHDYEYSPARSLSASPPLADRDKEAACCSEEVNEPVAAGGNIYVEESEIMKNVQVTTL